MIIVLHPSSPLSLGLDLLGVKGCMLFQSNRYTVNHSSQSLEISQRVLTLNNSVFLADLHHPKKCSLLDFSCVI